MTNYAEAVLQDVVEAARALSDPGRVRILLSLRERELCVCQIIELLDLAPSTISKHMTVLRRAGFVQSRKQGRWVYYRLADGGPAAEIAAKAAAWAMEAAKASLEALDDGKRLKNIMKINQEELCRNREK